MPRQMPEHRLLQRGNHGVQAAAARSRAMASAAAPTPGRMTWLAARILRPRPPTRPKRAEPLQGELQRGDVGAAAGDDHDIARAHKHPLGARQLARLRGESPDAGCGPTPLKQDSIMWCEFSPRTLMCSAAPRVSRQRAEEMRHQFGRQFADALAIEASFPHEVGPAARDRARPAPPPRPWPAGSRSGRCRACRPAPRAAPRPSASAQSSTV